MSFIIKKVIFKKFFHDMSNSAFTKYNGESQLLERGHTRSSGEKKTVKKQIAVEHESATNTVCQAYIHRIHYDDNAPRDTAKDLHRAIWFMLKPQRALLQGPSFKDIGYDPSYMHGLLKSMHEWNKVTDRDLTDWKEKNWSLFFTPSYIARPELEMLQLQFEAEPKEIIIEPLTLQRVVL